jgi:hypothetical protein
MEQGRNGNAKSNESIIREIVDSLDNLKYGYIQITVHNSRIVQIDRTEKTRFDDFQLAK